MNSSLKKRCAQEIQRNLFTYFVRSIFLVALLSNSASAAVWLFDPTVSLSQEYDDNYRLATSSSNEDEVSTTKLSGELALKGKSERFDLKALLGLDAINYSGDDDNLDDKNNQSVRLTSSYRTTERSKFSLKGNYFRDTIVRTTRFLFLSDDDIPFDPNEDVFDPNEDVDVNLVRDDARRNRFTISPGWNYRLSEITSLGLGYKYNDLSFSGEDSNSGLVESDSQTIQANIKMQVTEKDMVTGRISESYFRPDNDRDVDTLGVTLGWVHKFSESFEMDFTVGVRDSDFDNAQKSSDSGFVGNIGATKRTGLTTYRVNLERRENPSSSGNQVEVDQINVAIQRELTEKLTFSFAGRFFDTETTDDSNSNSNREYISFEPGLSWRFLPSWVAGAGYKYAEEDLDGGGSGDSNGAFIKISWSPPRQF
ncbi:MAG: hypothetical protein KJO47_00415 [Gammaproteobacteria bacterium]|nr:hypothetical protein [Gammaproteobacteria bacterium]